MPELPEVEVTRRSIAPGLWHAQVLSVRVGKALRWPLGCSLQSLAGLTVGAVERRGKYLWLPLAQAGGESAGGLLMHLGMSGSLAWHPFGAQASASAAAPEPGPHDHFDLLTHHGLLRLTDPRRFGAVVWSPALDAPPAATLLARLGAEPFDDKLTPEAFHAALRQRRAPLKAVLLAGDVIVGAGNIYACEALFQAGIDPRKRANTLSFARSARLLAALRATLAQALDLGGSTLRDFKDAHGMDGAYQEHAAVYGRAGEACLRCSGRVRRIVQSQRATYFCAACQKR